MSDVLLRPVEKSLACPVPISAQNGPFGQTGLISYKSVVSTKELKRLTMEDSFTKHLPFWLLAKNLKKRSFEA